MCAYPVVGFVCSLLRIPKFFSHYKVCVEDFFYKWMKLENLVPVETFQAFNFQMLL